MKKVIIETILYETEANYDKVCSYELYSYKGSLYLYYLLEYSEQITIAKLPNDPIIADHAVPFEDCECDSTAAYVKQCIDTNINVGRSLYAVCSCETFSDELKDFILHNADSFLAMELDQAVYDIHRHLHPYVK